MEKLSSNLRSYVFDFFEVRHLIKIMKINKLFFTSIKSLFRLNKSNLSNKNFLNKEKIYLPYVQKNKPDSVDDKPSIEDKSNYHIMSYIKKFDKKTCSKPEIYSDFYFYLRSNF